MVEIVRLSGYRLYKEKLLPGEIAYRWAALRNEVQKYSQLLSGLDWGWYLDDADKNTPIIDLLMSKLQNGELYFVFSKQEFVGIASINNIAWGRHGYIEAIATTAYRGSLAVGKAMGELITYAFNSFGNDGLGLLKLKATVATENISVAQMLANAGFKPLTVLPSELLFSGVPHDTILMELYHPQYFQVDKQVISNERSAIGSDPPVHELRSSGTPSTSTIGNGEYSGSTDGSAISRTSESDNGGRPELAEPEQLQWYAEPISSGGTGGTVRPAADTADGELVQPKRDPAAGIRSPIPSAAERPKLRKLRPGDGGTDTGAGEPERIHSSTGD
jgi:RimJ/RimL family protein N-acetyltransferase